MTQQPIIAWLLLFAALLLLMPLLKRLLARYHRKITYQKILKEIDFLFTNTNPFEISTKARQNNSPEFLYGEIEICNLLDLLAITKPLSQQRFYDLGSGCGKAVLAVKLRYPKLHVTGIEQIAPLHELAVQKYQLYLKTHPLSAKTVELNLLQTNFLSHDIHDADIVFINATAYGQATWQQILDKLLKLKAGARVIVTSKTLPERYFCTIYQSMTMMSWGLTSTFIYVKRD